MDECQELAQSLFPRYLAWNLTLDYVHQGHSAVKVTNWVMQELRATESYVVIDNVTEQLLKLVFDDGRNIHKFVRYPNGYITPRSGLSTEDCQELGKIHAANGWVKAQPGNYSDEQLNAYLTGYELEKAKGIK